MLRTSALRWLPSWLHRGAMPRPTVRRLRCELLEDRSVPATITWNNSVAATGGDFSLASNWQGGVVPGAADDAVINLASAGTVTYNTAAAISVGSITTNSNSSFAVAKGTVTIAASPAAGVFGAAVSVASGATLAAGTGAKVQINAGVTVGVAGTLSVSSPTLFVGVRGGFSTGPAVNVTNGGLFQLTNASLTATGTAPNGGSSFAQINLGSGATFKSANSTVGWDTVTFDANSVEAVGDITSTTFDATVITPVKLQPVFVGNKSFKDVNLTGTSVQTTLNVAPLGTSSTAQRYVFPSGTFTVASGTTVNFTSGANVQLNAGSTVAVNGTLTFDSPAALVAQRGGFGTGSAVTVGNGGSVSFANANLTATGTAPNGGASNAVITVGSGGGFKAANSTISWDSVLLNATSVLAAGDVTTSTFDAVLTTPIKYQPVFVGNKRFTDVDVIGTTEQATMTLGPVGLDPSLERYVFPAGTLTIAAGNTVNFTSATNAFLAAGATIAVNGTLAVDGMASLAAQRGGFSTGTLVSVGNGGTLRITNTNLTSTGTTPNGGASGTRITVANNGQLIAVGDSFGWDTVTLASGSTGRVQYSTLYNVTLNVDSGTNLPSNSIRNNDFSNIAVVATGSPTATIDLTNNYWGSTVSSVIDTLITDNKDSTTRPTVNYTPYLTGRPVQILPVAPAVLEYSTSDQTVTLTAAFRSPSGSGLANVNSGTVKFTVLNGSTTIGAASPLLTVTLGATSSSGLAAAYSIVAGGTGIGSITNNVLAITQAGTIFVQANQIGDANYLAATPAQQTVTVNKASQSIPFPTIPPVLPGGSVTLPPNSSAGLPIQYLIVPGGTGIGTLSGNVLTATQAGTIIIRAEQPGNANYSAATPIQFTITVNQASQFITFPPVPPLTYPPSGTITLGATSSSGLTVVYTILAGGTEAGTVSGNVLTITAAGTIIVQADQPGNVNYTAATPVQQTITVDKASQAITVTPVPPLDYEPGLNIPLSPTGGGSASAGPTPLLR